MIVQIRIKKYEGNEHRKSSEQVVDVEGLGIETAIGMIRDAASEIDQNGSIMSLVIAPDIQSADEALAAWPRHTVPS